jgi:hypothetical protein
LQHSDLAQVVDDIDFPPKEKRNRSLLQNATANKGLLTINHSGTNGAFVGGALTFEDTLTQPTFLRSAAAPRQQVNMRTFS